MTMKLHFTGLVRPMTKGLASMAIAATLAFGAAPAQAQSFPEETIHVVVPWKAGGGTDRIGRAIASALEEAAGVSVVVDNISGAGGITGSLNVAQGKADGYTLLMNGSSDMTAAMTFQPQIPISLDDFTFIGGFYNSPTWVLANADRGHTDLNGLIEQAKANPNEVTIGTAGPAGAQMLMAAAIKGSTGADFRIIPFSGGADLKKALLGDQVDAGIIHAPVLMAEAIEGLITVLGTGESLSNITHEPFQSIATLEDIGVPIQIGITRGLYVPTDTPDDVVARLRELAEEAARSDGFKEFGENFGFRPVWIPGEEFEAQVRAQLDTFSQIKTDFID